MNSKELKMEYDSKYIIKEYNKTIKEPTGFMRESKEMRI